MTASLCGQTSRAGRITWLGRGSSSRPAEEELEAEVVGFRATGEHWNEYLLDDGTVFKIKLVVTEIARVKNRYDAKGDPIYDAATHTQVTAIDAPDSMRHAPDAG